MRAYPSWFIWDFILDLFPSAFGEQFFKTKFFKGFTYGFCSWGILTLQYVDNTEDNNAGCMV